jgi:hypothetical protein
MKLRFPLVAMMLLLALANIRQSYGQSVGGQPVVIAATAAPTAPLPIGSGIAPIVAAPAYSVGGQNWQPAVFAPVTPAGYSLSAGCGDPNCTDPGCSAADCTAPAGAGGCTDLGCTDLGCGGQCYDPSFLDCLTDRLQPTYGHWGSIDYMHVWTKGRYLPPLVTTSPAGTAFGAAGVLPAASTLFGGGKVGNERQSGGRLDLGIWLDDCQTTGIGFRFFGIEGDRSGFNASSPGTPILATPYLTLAGINSSVVAAHPGNFSGKINVTTDNDVLSAETYGRILMARSGMDRVDLIGGYHYAQVSDGLVLASSATALSNANGFAAGTVNTLTDRFNVRNDFHGGMLGLTGEFHQGRWTMRSLGKVSLGDIRHRVTIEGVSVTTVPPPPAGGTTTVVPGGIFAQRSNMASSPLETNQFTYIPEINLGLGYQMTPHIELTAGYNFLYFPHIALAGDQIDTTIDFTQANPVNPVGARPLLPNVRDTDFWVQGISLGANWTF